MIRTDGLGILVRLTFSRRTRVLSIVGKLMRETMRGDRVRVNDRSTTSSNHSPHTALGVEDGELERSAGGRIEFLDVGFFLSQIATERSRPDLMEENESTTIPDAQKDIP
jgi:hypothetical protein